MQNNSSSLPKPKPSLRKLKRNSAKMHLVHVTWARHQLGLDLWNNSRLQSRLATLRLSWARPSNFKCHLIFALH